MGPFHIPKVLMAHVLLDARFGCWRPIKCLVLVCNFAAKNTNGDPLIMPTAALSTVRKHLDEIDQQIVALLNQRARIVAEVGKIKQEAHLPVAAPAREQQVLDHIVQLGGAGPLPPDRLRRIYQTVIQEMRTWEEWLAQKSG